MSDLLVFNVMQKLPDAGPRPSRRSQQCPCLQRWWGFLCSFSWSFWRWNSSEDPPKDTHKQTNNNKTKRKHSNFRRWVCFYIGFQAILVRQGVHPELCTHLAPWLECATLWTEENILEVQLDVVLNTRHFGESVNEESGKYKSLRPRVRTCKGKNRRWLLLFTHLRKLTLHKYMIYTLICWLNAINSSYTTDNER